MVRGKRDLDVITDSLSHERILQSGDCPQMFTTEIQNQATL